MRSTFDDIMRFWFDRGVAGFRIDVCNVIIKDALLRDNPAATEDDDFEAQLFGQRSVYNANRPEVHEVLRRLAHAWPTPTTSRGSSSARHRCRSTIWPSTTATGTTSCTWPSISPSSPRPSRPPPCAPSSKRPKRPCPPGAWPAWTGSNHDMFRFPTRWAGDDPDKARAALLMLLGLRGTPVLYQGDEIGQLDATLRPGGPA